MKWKSPLLGLPLPLLFATMALAQGPNGSAPILTNNGADITISSEAWLEVRGPVLNQDDGFMIINGEMRVHDWITNNGSSDFSGGTGTVIFFGPSFQAVNGSHASTFPNVGIDKSSGNLLLEQATTLEGNMVLSQGGVDLNGQTLSLSPTSALIGENNSNYVFGTTGKIAISLPLNAPSNLNVANLGAVITSGQNPGMTTVIRGHEVQTGNGFESIERYYEITPVNNSSLDATLEFWYLDHELNGQAEDKFVLYRSDDNGNTWDYGGGNVNAGANKVVLSGINGFSRWTVTNRETNPLSGLHELNAGSTNAFFVFPNPVPQGNSITLGLIQPGEYWVEIIDAQGKVLSTSSISSSGIHDLIEVQAGIKSPGSYFLLIRDRQSGQPIYGASSILIH